VWRRTGDGSVQVRVLYRRSIACTLRSSKKPRAELPAKDRVGLVDWEKVGETGTARRGGEEWSMRTNSHEEEGEEGCKRSLQARS
jgi:hypothetical protein